MGKFMKSRSKVRDCLHYHVKEKQNMEPLVDDYDRSRWSTFFPLQIVYFLPLILFLFTCCCCFRGQLDGEADQDLVDEEGLRKDLREMAKQAKKSDTSLTKLLGLGKSGEMKRSETPSPRRGRLIRRRRVKRVAVIKRNVN